MGNRLTEQSQCLTLVVANLFSGHAVESALMNTMNSMHSLLYLSLGAGSATLIILFTVAMRVKRRYCNPAWRKRLPDSQMIQQAEQLVRMTISPRFNFSFALMQTGVHQHLDRLYTYDVIPPELLNGLLFQGVHRTPKGTIVTFELLAPATVYFLYHKWGDGGYPAFFAMHQKEWQLCPVAPQYDIHNGDHGLKMVMYRCEAAAGTYTFPATSTANTCFNIVFQAQEESLRTQMLAASSLTAA
jgi:hypothetical protein